ncbi:hypothetical protein [Cellvibrio mixtus]|uniref:hypothetical protein n=1 Tax=Cellvibrio mixtus TaxID=39650 RepID=UPI00058735CB|nr:hypothetical protein [Cellvibrio mixtus]
MNIYAYSGLKADGGESDDFIYTSIGGSVAHGGADNDVLVSSGPAYFQFNNLKEFHKKMTFYFNTKNDEVFFIDMSPKPCLQNGAS